MIERAIDSMIRLATQSAYHFIRDVHVFYTEEGDLQLKLRVLLSHKKRPSTLGVCVHKEALKEDPIPSLEEIKKMIIKRFEEKGLSLC